MKRVWGLFAPGIVIATLSAPAVEIGDPVEAVLREFGQPSGHIRTVQRELLTYPRGEIELISNAVTRVDLVSAEEATARKLARERAMENNLRWAALQQATLHAQGQSERSRVRNDPAFAFQPATDQVAYWNDFRQRFPTVDVQEDYASSLRLLELDLREKRLAEERANQIRALERRVAAAEERARDAEREAQRARSCYTGCNTTYPVIYPYPVAVVRRSEYRPIQRAHGCAPRPGGISITVGASSQLVRGNFGLVRN